MRPIFLALCAAAFGCDGETPRADAGDDDAGPPACTAPREMCGAACVDTDSNAANCGGCDMACGPSEVCADGVCAMECAGGEIVCEGGCISPESDLGFCGASGDCEGANAGVACEGDEVCTGGECTTTGLGVERIEIDAETITHLAFVPGRADELLIAEHAGAIAHYRIDGDDTERLGEFTVPEVMQHVDCGLLAIAFDPDWDTNQIVYAAHCTGAEFRSRITRLTWDGETYDGVTETAATTIEVTGGPARNPFNHAIGNMGFDPDGTMFFAIGDKGYRETGPIPTDLPGSLLRIVPNREPGGSGYTQASGNPFTDPKVGAPEVYAYGLRFGFRVGRDSMGRYFIGEVGDGIAEEVNLVDAPGMFFGWNTCEGPCTMPVEGAIDPLLWWRAMDETHPYYADDPDTEASTRNVVFVGDAQPADLPDPYDGLLEDTIVFGEVCLGWVRGARVAADRTVLEDRFLFHLAHVVGWTYAADGRAYAATFGSCDSTMMFQPAALWRVVTVPIAR
jgi:hypothetical protein